MDKKIITISRQCGSGGHTIGQEVAKRLGIHFYDKKIVETVAKRSGLSTEFIEDQGEYQSPSLLYTIATNISFGYNTFHKENMPLPDQIEIFQTELIKELAEKESCVIVGRGADYILKDRQDCLHVFIYGDIEERKKRVISEHGIAEGEAETLVSWRDKKRARHYKHYTDREWGKADNYNICLDSSYLGLEFCIDSILRAVQGRETENAHNI